MSKVAPLIGHTENEVDWISKPENLINCSPKFADQLEAIQDVRSMQIEARKISNARRAVGMSAGGTMLRIACFPHDLYCAIVKVNPFFLKDKKEFYAWLNKHPYYRVGGFIG